MASPSQLVLLPSEFRGDAQQITHDDLYHNWARWLPDSKGFVFTATREGHGAQIYLQKSISEPSHPISPEGVDSLAFTLSPDGTQVAGIGPDSLAYLYPVAGGQPKLIPGFQAGEQPIEWSRRAANHCMSIVPARFRQKVTNLDLATGKRIPSGEAWRLRIRPGSARSAQL